MIRRYSEISTPLGKQIQKIAHSNKLMRILLDAIDAGPYDGGCLIFAQALQMILGGELIRIIRAREPLTEHYGLLKDSVIYDADGEYSSAKDWLSYFIKAEGPFSYPLTTQTGKDTFSEIPENIEVSEKIAKVLKTSLHF